MKTTMRITLMSGMLLTVLAAMAAAGSKVDRRLEATIAAGDDATVHAVWVYLSDKGGRDLHRMAPAELVSEASLRRRANVLPPDALVDATDMPVHVRYVDEIAATGATVVTASRWLNAVSVRATAGQITRIASLPFVRSVETLGRYRRSAPPQPGDGEGAPPLPAPKTGGTHALDYGTSYTQVSGINVPAMHDLGNAAQGVIIGVFDNGFRLPAHESFDSMKILATYDFVDNKVSVVPNNPSTSFGDHGVNTLSTIGGFKPGKLVGPAYGATYILARTENDSSETPLEEDKWVRGIEWADSLGVQVTSTSLGYLDYNTGWPSWTWEDMDGRTTVISRAAAMAVRKGILVVNSAGNEGFNATRNTLVAPADADSVLAAGAVGPDGKRASFSSVGPSTADPPRIKPDLMAQGTSVFVASAVSTTGYQFTQGTSFSCPLAAGAAALLVKAHPQASPVAIIYAMKQTASQSSAPDNQMGWGIINTFAAHVALGGGTDTNELPRDGNGYALAQNYPNPFNPGTSIFYGIPSESDVMIGVYDVIGREVVTLVNRRHARGTYQTQWNGTDRNGIPVAAGVYLYRLVAAGVDGNQSVISNKMLLVR